MIQSLLKRWAVLLLAGTLILLAVVLGACATPAPEATPPPPEATEVPTTPPAPPPPEAGLEVPFEDDWAGSPHADASAEAFVHWDEDDPPEVSTSCAKCHSSFGFQDFLGVDGTAAGVVDNAAPIGSVVDCVACHNEATLVMDSVTFPSGAEVTDLGREARCLECHQGRESSPSVDEAIAEAGLIDEDEVSEELGFVNIHYYAAAATLYGTEVMGGYEYEGKSYDAKLAHAEGFETCIGCHDSHTLELKVEACSTCHAGVASDEDLAAIRMQGSLVDYDGDGDAAEGIKDEMAGLQEKLYEAIQSYAAEISETPIVYDAHSYPYFFIDTNANGEPDEDEISRDNGYNAWTGRLLKAAYNYQTSVKDPGAYAHGGKYIIQLLYDSIEDLNTAVSEPVDLTGTNRIDDGHFDGSGEAFRHWDEDGEVSASCSKCHSATGLPLFLEEGVTISQPLANGLNCATCHDDPTTYTTFEVAEVEFPSGSVVDSGDPNTNLCMNCHQGRESTVSVNRLTAGLPDDTVSEDLRFLNVHYFAAGATLFGTEAQGAYEYDGKSYVGRNAHVEGYDNCTQCHNTHGLDVEVEACSACHTGVESEEDLLSIRMSGTDYDGDGDTTEGLAGEVSTMSESLYAAMQDYAASVVGTPIVYESHSYPYFFIDTNANGEPDEDELSRDNGYNTWTPRLLRAAYNYQYSAKDPGAFTHNAKYILQVLYDGLQKLGAQVTVDMTGMVRP
jgi:hypothetical protein